MFWGSFTYDMKGPCHIWDDETEAEKKASQAELDALNRDNEAKCRQEWEVTTGMRRLALKNLPGKRPQWKFTKKTGKLVRESKKGGIDWYRYGKVIVEGKIIPFAKTVKQRYGDAYVQEDKAPSHAHKTQKEVYNLHDVKRLLWPGNSPDLNMIEPCWYWMKRKTTVRGAPRTTKKMRAAWLKAWNDLPQRQIQAWIERIIRHIKEVIRLEGGNEYREDRTDHDNRLWKGRRLKGQLSESVFLGTYQRSQQQFERDSDLEGLAEAEPSESGSESSGASSSSGGSKVELCLPQPPRTPVRRPRKTTVTDSERKKRRAEYSRAYRARKKAEKAMLTGTMTPGRQRGEKFA